MGKPILAVLAAVALLAMADPAWAVVAMFTLVLLLAGLCLLIELANLIGRWDASDPEKETPPEGRQ